MLQMIGVSRISVGQKLLRPALALSLLGAGMGTFASQPVSAQDSGLLSTSTVVPADVVVYAEILLDSESEQLQMLDDTLARLGSEDSLIEAITETTESQDFNVDLDGAEIAVGVLPVALEEGAAASESVIDGLSGDLGEVTSDLEDVDVASDGEGVVIVIKPVDIDALETEIQSEIGADAESEDYLGHDVYTAEDDDGSTPTVYAIVDDFVLIGGNSGDVKQFIDASLDGGSSLASVDQFQTASDLLPQERVAFAFTDGSAILDSTSEAAVGAEEIVQEALSGYQGYTGMAIVADEPGLRFETVQVPASGADDAVAAGTAADLDMASRVPIETSILSSGYDLGQTTLLKGAGLALVVAFSGITSDSIDDSDATPVPVSVDDMYESIAGLLGFNLKTEFIDQMTGSYGFAVWGIETAGDDISQVSAVLVSNTEDTEAVENTVFTLSSLVQAVGQGEISIASRPVEGGSVNNVTFESEGSEISVDFGVVGDEFVLGVGDGATVIFSGPAESLADSERYQTALSYLPEEYQAVYYMDVALIAGVAGSVDPTGMSDNEMMAGTTAESFASVTHVTDGYVHTSSILVVE